MGPFVERVYVLFPSLVVGGQEDGKKMGFSVTNKIKTFPRVLARAFRAKTSGQFLVTPRAP